MHSAPSLFRCADCSEVAGAGRGVDARLKPARYSVNGSRTREKRSGKQLSITKGSALEIPQNIDDASNRVLAFKGRALGYEIAGAPNVPV